MIVVYETERPHSVTKIVTLLGFIPLYIRKSRVTL